MSFFYLLHVRSYPQVTRLFREHPDLLEDFTYFLPDAVQNQARERLAKAAAASKKAIQDRELAREQDRQQVKDQYEHFADVRTRTAREMERNRYVMDTAVRDNAYTCCRFCPFHPSENLITNTAWNVNDI